MICWVTSTMGIEVEGEKGSIWDDGVLFVGKRTGCATLCGAQGASAGFFDILVLPLRDGAVASAGNAAKVVWDVGALPLCLEGRRTCTGTGE